jgi:hypothetical protein
MLNSQSHAQLGRHTALISAPSLPLPLATATALPRKFASDFCFFTSCEEPNESDAARFSADIA